MMQDRLPPHDIDSEIAVLGSILIDSNQIKGLSLRPDDFYDDRHSIIYKAMLDLKEAGKGINQITVAQKLEGNKDVDVRPGFISSTLNQCIADTPTSMDCLHYADIVQRLSSSRRLIMAGEAIARMGYEADAEAGVNLAKADRMLLDLRKTSGGGNIITPEDRDRILIERYTNLYEKTQGIAMSTGLIDLDRRLGGGLFPGDFMVIGARPGVGKTTIMENIANHIGQDNNVLFCSAEMNVESLGDRDVAGYLGLSVDKIRYGNYDDDVIDGIIGKALPWLMNQQIYHLDFTRSFQITTANIYQSAYEIKERHGLSAIFIDYLGLLTDRYGNNENERLGYITRTLKEMAMTLDVPVVAATQLNRDNERRENKRPQLQDSRSSGNIEQDADVVLFLYRESYYNKESDNNITEVLIAKKRQGSPGRAVRVLWDEKHHKYCNLAREDEQAPLMEE